MWRYRLAGMGRLWVNALSVVIGKRIQGLVVAQNQESPRCQIFLIFDDGTHYELYGSDLTKRSPNKIVVPFGNLTRKNERQRPLGSPSEPAESPVASNQNSASESESAHFGFCSLGEPINSRQIFEPIGVVSVMTTEDSCSSPSTTETYCKCAAIRWYASMIQSPTDDEIAIIYLAFRVGWDNAEQIAPAMGLKSNRPLRKLLT